MLFSTNIYALTCTSDIDSNGWQSFYRIQKKNRNYMISHKRIKWADEFPITGKSKVYKNVKYYGYASYGVYVKGFTNKIITIDLSNTIAGVYINNEFLEKVECQ